VKEILDEVDFKDKQRDYSVENLTEDQKQEVSLFHSIKQDPYYKHHLRTYLSRYAEDHHENALSLPNGPYDVDPDDFVKFDRISIFDFRRTLPQKERESKIDSKGQAWGHGKRKASSAVANVRAGSGKITVNGKPIL